jgi:sugar/nucleoside kinase (ribokinase family)
MTIEASRIVVVGSVALDSVTTPFGSAPEVLGGSASYFSLAARFFAPVCVVGVVGDDFSAEHRALLGDPAIDLEGLEVAPGKTFRWCGEYGENLNERRTLSTCLNVFENFRPRIPERFRDAPYVFLANIDPELQRQVLEQVRGPRLVICDTMNFWIHGKRDALLRTIRDVDVLIVNHTEACELTEVGNVLAAAGALRALGPRIVVVKKGEHGAFLESEGVFFTAPAYPVATLRDPTGAGDTFAGGFVGALARAGTHEGDDLRRAVVWGTVMASFCVEGFGVQGLCRATPEEMRRRYRRLREISEFDEG